MEICVTNTETKPSIHCKFSLTPKERLTFYILCVRGIIKKNVDLCQSLGSELFNMMRRENEVTIRILDIQ